MGTYYAHDKEQQILADATMWTMMKVGMAEKAYQYFRDTLCDDGKNHTGAVTIDREATVCYFFLQAGLRDYSQFSSVKELVDFYYQIKFCLRRLDFELSYDLQLEALTWLKDTGIWESFLDGMIERDCIHKELVRQKLAEGITELTTPPRKEPGIGRDADHTFSFIICVNEAMWLDEISLYIHNLNVPIGYGVEIVPVWDSQGMTEGYNRGMKLAHGKYKIYMHQDVFVCGTNMLQDILDSFSAYPCAGMLGLAGCISTPPGNMWWECEEQDKYMNLYHDTMIHTAYTTENTDLGEGTKLRLIDGVMMVTCVDVPWRDDILHAYHYYDLSQSMEFHRAGYEIVVPKQSGVWCLHEQSSNLLLDISFFDSKEAFEKEYGGEL